MSKKDKKSKKTEKRKKFEALAERLELDVLKTAKKKEKKASKVVTVEVPIEDDEPIVEQPKQSASPRLELILGNISRDGNIEVKMDWNQEFLNQIRQRGFSSQHEEEAIMSFLNWMFIVRLSDTPDGAIESVMPNDLKEALKQHTTLNGEIITG